MQPMINAFQSILSDVPGLRVMTAPDDRMCHLFRRGDLIVFDGGDLSAERGLHVLDLGSGPALFHLTPVGRRGMIRVANDDPAAALRYMSSHDLRAHSLGRVVGGVIRVSPD